MWNRWIERVDALGQVLQLRATRQQLLASNIANAETPGYVARDIDFRRALSDALAPKPTGAPTASSAPGTLAGDDPRHLRTALTTPLSERVRLGYTVQTQPALDQNSVDMDQQRANFVDNAVQVEATLRFINGHVKTMLSAIQGQ